MDNDTSEARAKMLEACGMWIDQWEDTAGSWEPYTDDMRPWWEWRIS